MNGRGYFGLRAPGRILGRRLGWISRRRRRNLWRLDRLADCLDRCGHLRMNHVGSTRDRLIRAIRLSGGRKARFKVLEGRASVPPKTPMLGFRCQALVSLSLPSRQEANHHHGASCRRVSLAQDVFTILQRGCELSLILPGPADNGL